MIDDVESLQNSNKYPIVLSSGCGNGAFGFSTISSFGETWLKVRNQSIPKGAISFLGSSSDTAWQDVLIEYFLSAMFDFYYHTIGESNNYAKIQLYIDYYWEFEMDSYETTMYNFTCFGDPTTQIYTNIPSSFDNVIINDEGNYISVNANVDDVSITGSSEDLTTFYDSQVTMNGICHFNTPVRPLYITITLRNYIPYRTWGEFSGDITHNQTWSGEVYVSDDVNVNSGVTLTIEPGTTIKFDSNTNLNIYGNLNAQGTPTQKITFTSASATPQPGDWNKIYFYNNGIDTLKHCDIEYGQGIYCASGSNVRLNNVTVTNCPPFGLYMNNAFAIVDSCNFSNNGTSGIYLYSSSPKISHTICTNNNYGLFCYNNYSEPQIGYSTFSNNNGDGIFSMYHAVPWLFYLEGVFPFGNNFMENNNNRGYAAVYYSWPFLGLASYAPGNNVIRDNGNYALQDLNPYGTINAICNYWGTTVESEIENMIYTNNSVNFIPFLQAPPSPPSNMNLLAGTAGLNHSLVSKTVASSDADEYNQLATTFLMGGNYEKARGLFQYVVENYPDSEAAKYALVHITACYDKLNEQSNVLTYLEDVAEINSKLDLSAFALALSVSSLEKAGEYDQAEERCLQLLVSSKDDGMNKNLVFVLANIYLNGLNEHDKAKQYFEELINKYPKDELAQISRDMLEIMDFRFIPKGDEPEKTQGKIAPTTFALSQNYPNPFNPETKIVYQLPEDSFVKLSIYNLQGQEIRELVNEKKQPGTYSIQWDGRNNIGRKVVSGVYLYVMNAGKFKKTKKMILLH